MSGRNRSSLAGAALAAIAAIAVVGSALADHTEPGSPTYARSGGHFNCSASVVTVKGSPDATPTRPIAANPAHSPCRAQEAGGPEDSRVPQTGPTGVTINGVARAETTHNFTTGPGTFTGNSLAPDQGATANSEVAEVTIESSAGTIHATGLRSKAEVGCEVSSAPLTPDGSATVATLTINGVSQLPGALSDHRDIDLNGSEAEGDILHLNHVETTGSSARGVPLLLEDPRADAPYMAVAESHVEMVGSPCAVGRIRIIQETEELATTPEEEDREPFTYTAGTERESLGTFQLAEVDPPKDYVNLLPGEYVFNQHNHEPTKWAPASVTCLQGLVEPSAFPETPTPQNPADPDTRAGAGSATVRLGTTPTGAGESVTCRFYSAAAEGPQGLQGHSITGATGETGATGTVGAQGVTGPQGLPGAPGPPGASGTPGRNAPPPIDPRDLLHVYRIQPYHLRGPFKDQLRVRVRCRSGNVERRCDGTVRFRSARRVNVSQTRSRRVMRQITLGQHAYRLNAGDVGYPKVFPSRLYRKIIRRRTPFPVIVQLTVLDENGIQQTLTNRFTLRLKR